MTPCLAISMVTLGGDFWSVFRSHCGPPTALWATEAIQQDQGEAQKNIYELETRKFIQTVWTHRCETLSCSGKNNFEKKERGGNKNCKTELLRGGVLEINPACQPNSMLQGSEVAMFSGKVPRCRRVPEFHTVAGFQDCKVAVSSVPRFQSSRLPGF